MSPGRVRRLSVVKRIDVLPRVPQFVRPFSRYAIRPGGADIVFVRQEDNQTHRPSRETRRHVSPEAVLFIDIAYQFNRFHGIGFHSAGVATGIIHRVPL